jgi:hypothetical protein
MRELKRDLWPHKVTIEKKPEHSITEMEVWMCQRFGGIRGRWHIVHQWSKDVDFYFRTEHDATMFALRWAS